MNISSRIASISESVTLAVSAKAKKMKKKGIDVVGFGAGEPDFNTPEHICQAAKQAIDQGFVRYTPASGTIELKEAVINKFSCDQKVNYSLQEVIICCGAKHALYNAITALVQEGDEVIIPAPYWVSYPEMVKSCGAKPVIVNTSIEDNFKLTQTQLKEAITPKTKLFILNSPSNPTGMVYNEEELTAIGRILLEHKEIICICDEIYEKLVYDNTKHISLITLFPELKERIIIINGVSKAYAMTGWRIGYAAGPRNIIKAMSNLQSHSTSNPTSISQKAALAALTGEQSCISLMVKEFQKRRDYMVSQLNNIEGIKCIKPQGAFYVFADVRSLIGRSYKSEKINSSLDFCSILLNAKYVALVPGEGFGCEGFVRFSYATSEKNIEKGINRIKEFVKELT